MVPQFVRNTLLSGALTERLLALPRDPQVCSALSTIVRNFEQSRASASEIQTELNLVKPILKELGYVFESKPQFFEEKIAPPDFALFRSEEDRAGRAPYWGTKQYYEGVLAVLLVKRYGRNLLEGIGGFYLEFDNRIPLFQSLYLSKKAGTPWSIITNGRNWPLLKRPSAFEKRIVEIDLERAVAQGDEAALHLFSRIFSCAGLGGTLGAFLEEERREVIAYLREKRNDIHAMNGDGEERAISAAAPLYAQLFPGSGLSSGTTQAPVRRAQTVCGARRRPLREHDQCDIFSYLFMEGSETEINLEEIITRALGERTKERLLGLRMLDMTPGFGELAARLVEAISYLSFLLPYREKRSFVAEWENERPLYRFILSHVLYGVEKQPFSLDVLQNSMQSRFGETSPTYRLGNVLLGIHAGAVQELTAVFERLKGLERLSSTLSARIKEDAVVKDEINGRLNTALGRVREIMDLATATYFDAGLEWNEIAELVYYIEGDEEHWQAARRQGGILLRGRWPQRSASSTWRSSSRSY